MILARTSVKGCEFALGQSVSLPVPGSQCKVTPFTWVVHVNISFWQVTHHNQLLKFLLKQWRKALRTVQNHVISALCENEAGALSQSECRISVQHPTVQIMVWKRITAFDSIILLKARPIKSPVMYLSGTLLRNAIHPVPVCFTCVKHNFSSYLPCHLHHTHANISMKVGGVTQVQLMLC